MKNLLGKRFGKLTVVSKSRRPAKSRRAAAPWDTWWKCKCDCGGLIVVHWDNLGDDPTDTTSCGCSRGTHKMSYHPLYGTWNRILNRCRNPKTDSYAYYGGRGIRVVRAWNKFENFRDWALSNGWKKGLTIDRLDPNKNYGPKNCRWATSFQQGEHRRNLVYVRYKGERLHLSEASRRSGIPISTLWGRLKQGWPQKDLFIKAARIRKK